MSTMSEIPLNEPEQPVKDDDVRHLTDFILLQRFVLDADVGAFGEIVQRYSSLVMSVCQRVARQSADAEDAFQATFLALAQRPGSVRSCRSLAGWLYTIAFRTTLRLVRKRKRNQMAELPDSAPSSEPDPLDLIAADREVAVLDEELSQLPDKYRDVLVMTYFGGQTSQQIADQLNESKGVIDGRLRQAKNLLRVRLARRSVALGVIALATSQMTEAASSVSPELVNSTISMGAQTLGGSVPDHPSFPRIKPIIHPEPVMLGTKIFTGSVCSLIAAGISMAVAGHGPWTPADDGESGDGVAALNTAIQEGAPPGGDTSNDPFAVTPPTIATASSFEYTPASNKPNARIKSIGGQGFSSTQERSVNEEILAALSHPVSLTFAGEIPLTDALQQINTELIGSLGNREQVILVDHKELDIAGVSALEDIHLQKSFSVDGVSMESALGLLLGNTQDPELDYVVRNEMLVITTREAADEELFTRVYNIETVLELFKAETVATRSDSGVVTTNETTTVDAASSASMRLVESLIRLTSSQTDNGWESRGGRGTCVATGGRLIVCQNRRGHKAVVDILEQLQETVMEMRGSVDE